MESTNVFDVLNAVNVNEHTEVKGKLTYLSWSWAWQEVKKRFPDAMYEVKKFDNGLPYLVDENTGYMVFTTVTINGETLEMWLPVMDYKNKALKSPDMTDINKTIMRCLTKNLAMFGLGLYIYSGEDLPTDEKNGELPFQDVNQKITEENIKLLKSIFAVYPTESRQGIIKMMLSKYGVEELEELDISQFAKFKVELIDAATKIKEKRITEMIKTFAIKSGTTEKEAEDIISASLGKPTSQITVADFVKSAKLVADMIKDLPNE